MPSQDHQIQNLNNNLKLSRIGAGNDPTFDQTQLKHIMSPEKAAHSKKIPLRSIMRDIAAKSMGESAAKTETQTKTLKKTETNIHKRQTETVIKRQTERQKQAEIEDERKASKSLDKNVTVMDRGTKLTKKIETDRGLPSKQVAAKPDREIKSSKPEKKKTFNLSREERIRMAEAIANPMSGLSQRSGK